MLTDYDLDSIKPIFSRTNLQELEEVVQEYLGTCIVEIDTFLILRICFTNFYRPPYDFDLWGPQDKIELSFITNRYLHFPRDPTKITLFVPATPELYPPSVYEQLQHDEGGVYTSGTEYLICWGL